MIENRPSSSSCTSPSPQAGPILIIFGSYSSFILIQQVTPYVIKMNDPKSIHTLMMLYGALAWLTFGVMSSKLALRAGTSLCSPTYASAQVPSKVVVLRPLAVGNVPFKAFTYLDLFTCSDLRSCQVYRSKNAVGRCPVVQLLFYGYS